jgi:hypothetical protein
MADGVEFKMVGSEKIERMFNQLGDATMNVLYNEVALKAGQFLVKAIKANTPVSGRDKSPKNRTGTRGALRRSTGYRRRRYTGNGVIFLAAGPRLYRGPNKSGFHSYWVEEGHEIKFRKNGPSHGKTKAARYIEKTFIQHESTLISLIQTTTAIGVVREARRLGGG